MGQVTATRQDVSRLLARVAFGATSADLDSLAGRNYADIVDSLLDVPTEAVHVLPDEPARIALQEAGRHDLGQGLLPEAQQWWLERMRTTPWPLEERMVLFWHDHFATGPGDPYADTGMLMVQNETLRRNALGNFRTMCEQITVDPAMLFWLSGALSTKGAPNENYGREFFELFTLGTIPQVYTEKDVRESARALTGWTCEALTRRVSFDASRHDAGTKAVLGRTITNASQDEYRQIVDVALAQDVAPLFVAYKMVLSFAYPVYPSDQTISPDPLVAKVAATLRGSNWDLKAAMRTMLLADEFRYAAPSAELQVVRQPIDLVVSACKAVGVPANQAKTVQLLRRMGQLPFQPPNVGGWPFGKVWLSPSTTLARYDWGVACYDLWKAALPTRAALPKSSDVEGWTALFGLASLSDNTRGVLGSYVSSRSTAAEAEKQTGVMILLASSPDWMVM